MKFWYILILFAIIIGAVGIISSLFYSQSGLNKLNEMRDEYHSLVSENKKLREENQQIRMQIELLKSDDRYIEKVARERNMIKDGDIVFRVK